MRIKCLFKFFPLIPLMIIFSACPTGTDNSDGALNIKTGRVTFVNHTSYKVIVHQNAFSGPVLLELLSGESKPVDVRASDNYGVGSTFSIEYISIIQIVESVNGEIREVFAGAIDPNVQINRVIEEGKSCTVQIPQPQNLEPQSAFIMILNSSNLQFELRYQGTVFKQEDNKNIPVAPYKTGIYKLDGIPAEGKLYRNYTVVSTFASATIPDFTTWNGNIESFTYNGSSVVHTKTNKFIWK